MDGVTEVVTGAVEAPVHVQGGAVIGGVGTLPRVGGLGVVVRPEEGRVGQQGRLHLVKE